MYPETSGWDVLLVAPSTEQIGVQAKLKANPYVVHQAIQASRQSASPDIVAVLTPDFDREFESVVDALGFVHLWGTGFPPAGRRDFDFVMRNARRRVTTQRCWVPEVEIIVPAGVPSPRTVSPWKMGAVKLCARLRAGEELTRKDFADLGIRLDKWVQVRWIDRVPGSKPARYTMHGQGARLPDVGYPEIVAALGLPAVRVSV